MDFIPSWQESLRRTEQRRITEKIRRFSDDSLFLPDEPVVVQEKTSSTSRALPNVDSVSAHPDVDEISFRARSRRTTL
eukprot:scaffold9683_cov83-Cylindrotheca_fusiformis.AAC.1